MGPPNVGIVNTNNLGLSGAAQSDSVAVVTEHVTLSQDSSTFSSSVTTVVTAGVDDVPIYDSSQQRAVSIVPTG